MVNTFNQQNEALRQRVKALPISSLIGAFVDLKRQGARRFVCLCPFHDERTPSCTVNDEQGYFKCFGCDAKGDAITFVERYENIGYVAALKRAADILGVGDAGAAGSKVERRIVERNPEQDLRSKSEQSKARDMWRRAGSIDGTLGERYFEQVRKIRISRLPGGALPISMRFNPSHEYWHSVEGQFRLIGRYPAILSPMQNAAGDVVAVHQIFLNPKTGEKLQIADPDCAGKFLPSKKMRGRAWGTAIRMGARSECMGASEGIENGLVFMAETGICVWPAGSLNNLAGGGIGDGIPHPLKDNARLPTVYPDPNADAFMLPPECQDAIIIKDSDSKDPLNADCLFERAGRRMALQGKRVSYITPPAGCDLNDVVMGRVNA